MARLGIAVRPCAWAPAGGAAAAQPEQGFCLRQLGLRGRAAVQEAECAVPRQAGGAEGLQEGLAGASSVLRMLREDCRLHSVPLVFDFGSPLRLKTE